MRWPSPSSPAARKRIRRGVFKSVAELESAIIGIPRKSQCRAKALNLDQICGEILKKVARAKQALESQH
jgi:hypothetical protein